MFLGGSIGIQKMCFYTYVSIAGLLLSMYSTVQPWPLLAAKAVEYIHRLHSLHTAWKARITQYKLYG